MNCLAEQILSRREDLGPLVLVDGGSAQGADLGRWQFLGPRLELHGFEADPTACAQACARAAPGHRYYPCCLGRLDGQRRVFYRTAASDTGGLYAPLEERIRRWKSSDAALKLLPTLAALKRNGEVAVETISLDAWRQRSGVARVDFIKLGVQGAELEVLQGAEKTLEDVLGIDLNVNFVQVYEGQPLFAEVDAFLRGRGFTFFNFHYTHTAHFVGRVRSEASLYYPDLPPLMRPQLAGQLVAARALYLVDPLDFALSRPPLSVAQRLKLAIIAELYGQVEFGFELLHDTHKRLKESNDRAQADLLGEIVAGTYTAYRGMSIDVGKRESDRPFGGDSHIAAELRRLVQARGIRTIVETGTFRGTTAAALAGFGPQVHTIEIDRDHSQRARDVLANLENVAVHRGHSPDVLDGLLPTVDRPALFYLDAHWNENWPILDELAVIARHGLSDSVIVVHDCEVPGRPFGFDSYHGQSLCLEFLAEKLRAIYPGGFAHHYNEQAEGDRRGVLYVEPIGTQA